MKRVFRIDSNGYYVEDVIIQDDDTIPVDCVDTIPPNGLHQLKWVENSWVEGMSQSNILSVAKTNKIEELNNKCDYTIMGGFTSSALGVQHTYQSLLIDEVWLNSTLHRFAIDPNFTTVNYKTIDAGYLPHTKAQFQQVFIDGHTFGDSQITKLNNLKSQVMDNATDTIDKVNAITW